MARPDLFEALATKQREHLAMAEGVAQDAGASSHRFPRANLRAKLALVYAIQELTQELATLRILSFAPLVSAGGRREIRGTLRKERARRVR